MRAKGPKKVNSVCMESVSLVAFNPIELESQNECQMRDGFLSDESLKHHKLIKGRRQTVGENFY